MFTEIHFSQIFPYSVFLSLENTGNYSSSTIRRITVGMKMFVSLEVE